MTVDESVPCSPLLFGFQLLPFLTRDSPLLSLDSVSKSPVDSEGLTSLESLPADVTLVLPWSHVVLP